VIEKGDAKKEDAYAVIPGLLDNLSTIVICYREEPNEELTLFC
jgi:hypothetical protein